MAKLIALIDGSVYAHSVCEHAAWIAQRADASVEVVHVLGRRDGSKDHYNLSGSIGLGARSALLDELSLLDEQRAKLVKKRGREILDDAKAHILAAGVTNVTTRLRHGEIVETVQELEADADLIVIGKRGEAADFDHLHLGSNLERVARSSQKPILVAARAYKPVQRVLIAFDGGRSVGRAIDMLAQASMFKNLDCHLLSVGHESSVMTQRLQRATKMLSDAGYSVTQQQLPGIPESVITKQVVSQGFDLLMMGAFGHTRIRNLFIGSTTTEMIRSCKIPVLLFR